jgi:hypothetical protein
VVCRALKHVQSQGNVWTQSVRSEEETCKKAADSREPDPNVNLYVQRTLFIRSQYVQCIAAVQSRQGNARSYTAEGNTKEIRYRPAKYPTTSGNCTRRPDTKRTTQSCDKVKPERVTGERGRRNTKLRTCKNPARQRSAHDAQTRRIQIQSDDSEKLERTQQGEDLQGSRCRLAKPPTASENRTRRPDTSYTCSEPP